MPGFGIDNKRSNNTTFLKKYRWYMSIPRLNLDWLYLKSFKPPNIKIGTEEFKGVSITYQIAKEAKFEDMSIAFYETDITLKLLIDWKNSVYNFEEGYVNTADKYCQTVKFYQLKEPITTSGGMRAYVIEAYNVFPKSLDFDTSDYSTGGIKLITMSLACSHAKYIF
jgi:hypothetical protein